MDNRGLVLLGVAAAALFILSQRANAAVQYESDPEFNPEGSPEVPTVDLPSPSDLSGSLDFGTILDDGTNQPVFGATGDANMDVNAFLYMLRCCENSLADAQSGAAYLTFYGGSRFTNTADHPVLTGEKQGVPLSSQMCINAGYASGICVSTAAGAYQINVPTWRGLRAISPRLPDFSPASQDEAAIRLLKQIGAYDAIVSGDIEGAINLAGSKWASLPSSTARQGGRTLDYAMAHFNEYSQGGVA